MRRLGLRVVECLAKDFHRVCSKLRCEHKQVAPQPFQYHDTISPLGHPDSGLPPCTYSYFWAISSNTIEVIDCRHGALSIELNPQPANSQTRTMKLPGSRTRFESLLMLWAGHFSCPSLSVLMFKMGRIPLWTELCPSKIHMLKPWPLM